MTIMTRLTILVYLKVDIVVATKITLRKELSLVGLSALANIFHPRFLIQCHG